MTLEDLRTLLDYHYWARDRMLEAVEPLTPEQFNQDLGSSFRSVRETLVHVYSAEWAWHSRWQGVSPTSMLSLDGYPDVAALQVAWTVTEQNVRNFVEAGGEQGVHRVFEYKTLAGVAGAVAPLADGAARGQPRELPPGPGHNNAPPIGRKTLQKHGSCGFLPGLPAHRRRRAGLRCIVRASRARRHTSARDIKETRMASGTIKRIARDKGFGFIRDGGGQEWFFHRSSVQGSFDSLNEGQRVSFDEEQSPKGPRGAPTKFAFDGTMSMRPTLKVEGALSADAASLRRVVAWAGQKPLPVGGFERFSIKAQTNVVGGTIALTGANLELDGNPAEGVLTFRDRRPPDPAGHARRRFHRPDALSVRYPAAHRQRTRMGSRTAFARRLERPRA